MGFKKFPAFLHCFLSSLILSLMSLRSGATHIAGGDITYRHLGGTQYEVTVRIFFDCFYGSSGAISSDMTISVGFFDVNNNLISSVFISGQGPDTITNVSYPCIVPPSNFCIMKYVYVTTVNIPAPPGGFKAVFQRCCRNNIILNIVDPGNTGASFFTDVPDMNQVGTNNSPVFNYDPPVYLCINKPVQHDYSATDPDGDSLVYELFTPFSGASAGNPQPQPPGPPPYSPVTWAAGYSQANMLGTTPPMTIDPHTGMVTVTPTQLGVFVIGVRVKEYRNGVYIGETKRDYQYNVINCTFSAVAAFTTPQVNCSKTVSFQNNSQSANQFFWDFGVPGSTSDTSSAFAPVFTYPDFGTYEVTLVASDTICSDTVKSSVTLFPKPQLTLSIDSVLCGADSLALNAILGPSWPSAVPINYQWTASPASSAILDSPNTLNTAAFVSGTVTFTLSATVPNSQCDTSVSTTVQVFPVPQPDFSYEESAGCLSAQVKFQNLSQNASSIQWKFTPGGSSTESSPVINLDLGTSVLVELTATNGPCSAKDTQTVTVQAQKPVKEPIPNIFTPFTEDALNDCFDISNSPDGTACFDLLIYNRWGQVVYDSKTDGPCWNGKLRNAGGKVTPGVYFYLLYVNGEKKEAGHVTVPSP